MKMKYVSHWDFASQAILYGWSAEAERKKLYKIIRKYSSVLGCPLDSGESGRRKGSGKNNIYAGQWALPTPGCPVCPGEKLQSETDPLSMCYGQIPQVRLHNEKMWLLLLLLITHYTSAICFLSSYSVIIICFSVGVGHLPILSTVTHCKYNN